MDVHILANVLPFLQNAKPALVKVRGCGRSAPAPNQHG